MEDEERTLAMGLVAERIAADGKSCAVVGPGSRNLKLLSSMIREKWLDRYPEYPPQILFYQATYKNYLEHLPKVPFILLVTEAFYNQHNRKFDTVWRRIHHVHDLCEINRPELDHLALGEGDTSSSDGLGLAIVQKSFRLDAGTFEMRKQFVEERRVEFKPVHGVEDATPKNPGNRFPRSEILEIMGGETEFLGYKMPTVALDQYYEWQGLYGEHQKWDQNKYCRNSNPQSMFYLDSRRAPELGPCDLPICKMLDKVVTREEFPMQKRYDLLCLVAASQVVWSKDLNPVLVCPKDLLLHLTEEQVDYRIFASVCLRNFLTQDADKALTPEVGLVLLHLCRDVDIEAGVDQVTPPHCRDFVTLVLKAMIHIMGRLVDHLLDDLGKSHPEIVCHLKRLVEDGHHREQNRISPYQLSQITTFCHECIEKYGWQYYIRELPEEDRPPATRSNKEGNKIYEDWQAAGCPNADSLFADFCRQKCEWLEEKEVAVTENAEHRKSEKMFKGWSSVQRSIRVFHRSDPSRFRILFVFVFARGFRARGCELSEACFITCGGAFSLGGSVRIAGAS